MVVNLDSTFKEPTPKKPGKRIRGGERRKENLRGREEQEVQEADLYPRTLPSQPLDSLSFYPGSSASSTSTSRLLLPPVLHLLLLQHWGKQDSTKKRPLF